MTITLGDGDFIITANSTDFERARADIFGVMRRIDDRADQSADLIDRRFTESAADITRQFEVAGVSMERSITRATENISDEVRQMGHDIERSVSNAASGLAEEFGRELQQLRLDSQRTADAVGNDADNMGDAIARGIARGVAVANAALALLSDGSDRALSRIVGLAGGFGKLVLATGALSGAMAGLVQLVAAVVTSLEQLAGVAFLAPTAILGLVSIIGTLKIALNGVGDAIGAGFSTDWEKFNAAVEKLSPAARAAVVDLVPMFVRLRDLKSLVQERFFTQLDGELARFGSTAAGVAERQLPQLSTALGKVAASFLGAARTTDFFPGIEAVLTRTAAGIDRLSAPVAALAAAFGDLFVVGAGYVDGFYASLGKLIDRFATWIKVSADNGNLRKWIDGAIAGFQQIGRIIGNLGGIFAALNSTSGAAGTGILAILENITQRFKDAFQSDVGQSFLISAFSLLAEVMKSLNIILGPVVALLARLATVVNDQLARAVAYLNPYLEKFAGWIGGIGKSVSQAAPQVTAFASGAVGYLAERFAVLKESLSGIGDAVAGTGSRVADAFSGIGTDTLDDIVRAVGSLGVALAGIGSDVLVGLSGVFAELTRLLPRVITLFQGVASTVGRALVGALDALKPLLDPLLTFFEKLQPVVDLAGTTFVVLVKGVSDLAVALSPLADSIADVAGGIADDLNPAVQDFGESVSRTAAPAVEKLSQSLGDKLGAGFERIRPALNSLIEGFRGMGESATRLLDSVGRMVLALGPLASVLGEFGAVLYERTIPAVAELARILFAVLTTFADVATPIIRGLSEVLGEALAEAAEKLGPIFEDMGEKFRTVADAVKELQPVLDALGALLSVALPIALEVLRVAVTASFDTIIFVIRIAWEIISGVLGTIILFLSGDFAGAWDRMKEMISGIWDAVADYIVGVVRRIITFFENTGISDIARAVGRAFQAAYEAVASWLNSAFDAVVRWVADVLYWFASLPGLIGRAFMNAGDWLYNAGRDIVAGLINGLVDKARDLGNVVKDSIINPIKNALGSAAGFLFGSPSKVTTQYGKWISQGLAIGIKDAESSVVAAAESLTMAAALPGMTPGLSNMGIDTGPSPFVPTLSTSGVPGGGAVFGPGAVQVTFQGVVPSESEAFATGQAVGAGIADVIARRDARVSVGVL